MKLKSLITLTMSTVLLMSAPLFAKADPVAFEVKVTGKGQPMLFIPKWIRIPQAFQISGCIPSCVKSWDLRE